MDSLRYLQHVYLRISSPRSLRKRTAWASCYACPMQPHNVENPRPGNGKDLKRRTTTFWLLVVIVGLVAAVSVNLLGRL